MRGCKENWENGSILLKTRKKEAIDLKNKIEDRITFTVKSGYIWLSLAAETIKLHGSKKFITRDKNGVNVPHFQITEVVLVHCDVVWKDYQKWSKLFL